jgi:cytochrome c peroxidase
MKKIPFFILGLFVFTFGDELITPIPIETILNKDKVSLGKTLFLDTKLSKDNTISCGSCHILEEGGDDNLPVSFGIKGKKGGLNAPTVYNAKFNFLQFWDGRAKNLKEQAIGPIHNPVEMDANFPMILDKLKKDSKYTRLFGKVYRDGITQNNIIDAIVAFEETLTTPNSRFDRYLKKENTLSKEEIAGYKLFKEYGCISCHNGVNIGGNLFQKIGIISPFQSKNHSGIHTLKVPTLRNISKTAPYLHDGSIKNLSDTVKVMFSLQLGVEASQKEIDLIVSFLKTLDGEIPSTIK